MCRAKPMPCPPRVVRVHVCVCTSVQYCCLVSESMWAKPPKTRAFIRVLWTELDSRCKGGLRLANCLARFHQFSHCTTMLALEGWRRRERGEGTEKDQLDMCQHQGQTDMAAARLKSDAVNLSKDSCATRLVSAKSISPWPSL